MGKDFLVTFARLQLPSSHLCLYLRYSISETAEVSPSLYWLSLGDIIVFASEYIIRISVSSPTALPNRSPLESHLRSIGTINR